LALPDAVEQALDVAAVGEHERASLAEQPRRVVASAPGGDVIGHAGDHISIRPHLAHIERQAAHVEPSGMDIGVGADEVEEIGVQLGGKARGVVVPIENIEGRRRVAEQVVVDPIVPDQVVRPHPGEHAGELASLQHAHGL
jgi:hypothetical protein